MPRHPGYVATFTSGKNLQLPLISVILNVSPVGFVRSSPVFNFDPKRASAKATLTFTFTLAFKLVQFESIRFELPYFTGASFRDLAVLTNGSTSFDIRASWTTEGGSANMLIFTLAEGQHIHACQKVLLTVPASAGLHLPRNAVEANSTRYRMHVHGVNGILEAQPVISPAIGSFEGQVSFSPKHRSPSARTLLNFSFTPQMRVEIGETVSLHLPGFSGKNSACFPVISDPLGTFVLANWSESDRTLLLMAERAIVAMQLTRIQITPQSGIFLPFDGLRASQLQLTISSNAASGLVDRLPLEQAPKIGWFWHSDISFSPHRRDQAIEITLSFEIADLLSVNDTITLHLAGFPTHKAEHTNSSANTTSEDSRVLRGSSATPSRGTSIPVILSSSGVYSHPITTNGSPISQSSLPSSSKCVPCVSSFLYDGDDLADGYYASVCGLGASELWQGLHQLLLSGHENVGGGSRLRKAIEEVDSQSVSLTSEPSLQLLYTGERWIKNASSPGDEFQWSPSYAWPQALGVGYEQAACDGAQCASGNALTDLHHQFPADARVATIRASPLHYTSGTDQDIFKTSMLYSDCDDSCQKDSLAPLVRFSSDWSPFAEVFEPPMRMRGDLARAMFYMAVRYDGDDGLTDLELKDFAMDEDPECCYQTEFLQGCVNPVCHMGQLSTLLRWHLQDPPSSEERTRNDRVHATQGNRNPFVDFPQLTFLLWGNQTTGYAKFSGPGSLETLSDCGRDNSSFVYGEWFQDKNELILNVNRRIAENQLVTLVVPSTLGIRLPERGLFARNRMSNATPSMHEVSRAPYLSVNSSNPIMKTPVLRVEAVGLYQIQPLLKLGSVLAGAITSLEFSASFSVDLVDNDRLILQLPGFSALLEDMKDDSLALITGYAQNCSQHCNLTCRQTGNASNANDTRFEPQRQNNYGNFDNPNMTCWTNCEDKCEKVQVLSRQFAGHLLIVPTGIAISVTMSPNNEASSAESQPFTWPAGREINFMITSQSGIKLPVKGVPLQSHNISLKLARSNCSHLAMRNVGACFAIASFAPTASVNVQPTGVGSFDTVSLDYLPLIAGKSIQLTLELVTSVALTSGDFLLLHLPHYGMAPQNGTYYNTNAVIFTHPLLANPIYAVWSRVCPKDTLILMLLGFDLGSQIGVEKDSILKLIVPVQLGLMLPYVHLPSNLPTLTIGATTEDGTVIQRTGSISKSPAISTLNWRTTQVKFTPESAGKKTSIWFGFTTSDPLSPGDEITLKLPGFTAPDADCFPTMQMFPANAITSAAWNATEEQLLYRISDYISAGQQVWVLSDSSLISLPAEGVKSNDKYVSSSLLVPHEKQITVSATSAFGKLRLAPVAMVKPVGQIILSSSVSFHPFQPGAQVAISISIVALMDFFPGDIVTIYLPSAFTTAKFEHSKDPDIICIHTEGAVCNATFDSNTSELVMQMCTFVAAGTAAVARVPQSAGIRLPLQNTGPLVEVGERGESERGQLDPYAQAAAEGKKTPSDLGLRNILLSTNAADGSIAKSPPVVLAVVPVLATFNNSSLTFGPVVMCNDQYSAKGAEDTQFDKPWNCIKTLFLNFTVQIDLRKDDEIYLSLPGFTSFRGQFIVEAPNMTFLISEDPLKLGNWSCFDSNQIDCKRNQSNTTNRVRVSVFSDATFHNHNATLRIKVLTLIPKDTPFNLKLKSDSDNAMGFVPVSLNWRDPKIFTLAFNAKDARIAPTSFENVHMSFGGFAAAPTAEVLNSPDWTHFGLKLRFTPLRPLQLFDVVTWTFPKVHSKRWGMLGIGDDSRRYTKKNITINSGFICAFQNITQNTSTGFINCSDFNFSACFSNVTAAATPILDLQSHNITNYNATDTSRYITRYTCARCLLSKSCSRTDLHMHFFACF